MTIVIRDKVLYVRAGGSWARVPAPANEAAADPLAGFDITRYVTDVRVEEGVMVGGEPMNRITGVIDTSAALNGILGPSVAQAPPISATRPTSLETFAPSSTSRRRRTCRCARWSTCR
jgi:hypothetical protein